MVPDPQAAIGRSALLQRRAVRDGDGEARFDQVPAPSRAQRLGHTLRSRRRQRNHDPAWPAGFDPDVRGCEHLARALGRGRRAGRQDGRRGQEDPPRRRQAVPQVGARAPGHARHGMRRGDQGQPRLRGRHQAVLHAPRRPPLGAPNGRDAGRRRGPPDDAVGR